MGSHPVNGRGGHLPAARPGGRVPVGGGRPVRPVGASRHAGGGLGGFDPFLADTGKLLWYLPAGVVPAAGWAATVLEVMLAVGLVAGVRLRAVALAGGVLLSVFAVTMTVALGPEPPLSYSVWSAAAGAFLLASLRPAPGDVGAGASCPSGSPVTTAAPRSK